MTRDQSIHVIVSFTFILYIQALDLFYSDLYFYLFIHVIADLDIQSFLAFKIISTFRFKYQRELIFHKELF